MTKAHTTTLTDEQRANIDGLRDLVAFYEQHPEYLPDQRFLCFLTTDGADDARVKMADATRALGTADKDSEGGFFRLVRRFGPVELCIYALREQVCERIVIGTEEVDIEEPDLDAVAALPKVTRTETREVVEWRCPDSILRPVTA
jgi:hypothetical protein